MSPCGSLKRKIEPNENDDTFTIAKKVRCDRTQVGNEYVIKNSEPVLAKDMRLYDVIYTCRHEDDAHIYAISYHENEKTLAYLRNVLAVERPDHDGIIAVFMTSYKNPIIEANVRQWSLAIGREFHSSYVSTSNTIDDSVHFYMLKDQIAEITFSSESRSALVNQLAQLVEPCKKIL
ncbi:unnamed protein product [Didymodactylos carnosus]|uniref:Uncharacterized protein n=1 Tax=Didymodactylos carnosus TaxID=1234261 RepID=A0A814W5W2_9BILA|nr:unnamed protein product [Didymodactylos carnosus]CAF3961147.1 unnamed protein product [Didymodactylos carnosus]